MSRGLRRVLRPLVAVSACALAMLLLVALLAYGLRAPSLPVPVQGLALSGLTLVEPGLGRRPDRTLVVRGSRIVSIGGGPESGASDALAGSFVLPGLVDLHVHHPPALALGQRELFGLLFLRHGVTSVRDAGSFDGRLLEHRQRLAEGVVAGPRLFACGWILDGEPAGWPGARVVVDAEDARRAVDELAAAGVDCVKIYNGIDEDAFAAIRERAARHRLRVVAHVPFAVRFESMDRVEVQHLMGLAEEWQAPDPDALARYVRHSVEAGLSHTPTLVVYARAARLAHYAELANEPVARWLPRIYRELLWNPARDPLIFWLSPAGFAEMEDRYALMQRATRELHAAGVQLLAGTDTMNPFVVPGASLHEEIGHLAAAGLGTEAALGAATRGAGELLGEPGLGRLAEGAPADFALYAEDPTRDIKALGSLRAVVVDGRLYSREALDGAIARQLAHFDGPLYATLFEATARAAIALLDDTD